MHTNKQASKRASERASCWCQRTMVAHSQVPLHQSAAAPARALLLLLLLTTTVARQVLRHPQGTSKKDKQKKARTQASHWCHPPHNHKPPGPLSKVRKHPHGIPRKKGNIKQASCWCQRTMITTPVPSHTTKHPCPKGAKAPAKDPSQPPPL